MEIVTNTTNVIDKILAESQPVIIRIVEAMDAEYLRVMERPADAFWHEYHRLTTIHNLVKSVNKYTLPTDELTEIVAGWDSGCNVSISGLIARGGVSYRFSTEVIVAGGYNIQCAHYRYLTHTNLPQTGGSEAAVKIQEKIKRLTKLQKLNKDLAEAEKKVSSYLSEIERLTPMSEAEILLSSNNYQHTIITYVWAEINRINPNNGWGSEEKFNEMLEDRKASALNCHKVAIHRAKDWVKEFTKSAAKIRAKIEAL